MQDIIVEHYDVPAINKWLLIPCWSTRYEPSSWTGAKQGCVGAL